MKKNSQTNTVKGFYSRLSIYSPLLILRSRRRIQPHGGDLHCVKLIEIFSIFLSLHLPQSTQATPNMQGLFMRRFISGCGTAAYSYINLHYLESPFSCVGHVPVHSVLTRRMRTYAAHDSMLFFSMGAPLRKRWVS